MPHKVNHIRKIGWSYAASPDFASGTQKHQKHRTGAFATQRHPSERHTAVNARALLVGLYRPTTEVHASSSVANAVYAWPGPTQHTRGWLLRWRTCCECEIDAVTWTVGPAYRQLKGTCLLGYQATSNKARSTDLSSVVRCHFASSVTTGLRYVGIVGKVLREGQAAGR